MEPANMKRPDIPLWFAHVSSDALLNSREVTQIFGYANVQSLHCAIFAGCFPAADVKLKRASSKSPCGSVLIDMWVKSTIVAEIKRRRNTL